MLDGTSLPSNMAANTTSCLYLVKRLIVTLTCAVNVTTSSLQHFPWRLSAKLVVFRKRSFIILKISFWSRDQIRTYSFLENGAGLKNKITLILFKIWPTHHFSKIRSYNFSLRVRSFGKISIMIGDPRSLGSCCIKGTAESLSRVNWITDPGPDHPRILRNSTEFTLVMKHF